MTCLELINTLTNSKQVQVLDRSGLVELDIATVKWFKKHYADSHNKEVKYWLDMEVESSVEDNYGRLLITASYGLTKEAMKTLNHKIVDWLVLNNKKTYSDFVYYLENSNTLRKVNIPYDHLKERAKKLASEIIDDIDYLEKHKGCVV